jgi:hypothetical protein
MEITNNATWEDSFVFGDTGDVSWSFTGQHFVADIKGTADDPNPLLSLSDIDGEIVVDDAVQRILHFNVDDATIQQSLGLGCYVYDLVMYDTSVPPIRVVLMHGKLQVCQGVTQT